MKLHFNLFIAFFRSGLLGFGGGPSIIPLVHKEVVGTYKWMGEDEFSDVLALANTLPGPIMTKMAGYIGYRVGGLFGMLIALFAAVFPTIILMLLILTSFNQFKDNPRIQGMTNAVVPIVGVMMAVLTWQFFKNAKKGLGWKICFVLFVLSFVLIELIHVHPGVVIGLLLIAALLAPIEKEKLAVHDTKRN